MSGVVLRCPTCGTTQNHPGECDACYDDQVRYFCSNHNPALWLEKPVCRECGAKCGEAPRRHPVPPPRADSSPPARRMRRSEARLPIPPSEGDPRRSRPRDPEAAPVAPSLADLLASVLVARRKRTSDWAEDELRWERPELRLPRFALKRFIVRLVWLALLLLAVAVTVTFLLVGSALQVMGVLLGQP